MAWTSLTFAFGSVLSSAKMTQLYDNLTAVAQGLSGAQAISAPITGTSTNNDAAAGIVGEFISNYTSGVSLTSSVNANCGSISLTAGDWDVEAIVLYTPAASTSITITTVATNNVSATFPTFGTNMQSYVQHAFHAYVPSLSFTEKTNKTRYSLSGTTTIYCVVYATFTVSTLTAKAVITARRVR